MATISTITTTAATTTTTTDKINIRNISKHRSAYWRNKPQSNAISGGTFLFISGGMNLAQSLGWNEYSINASKYFNSCWFIGVILGCLIAFLLKMKLSKKYCMFSSSLLILLDGVIFASAPDSYYGQLIARYLNGIALGITWPIYLLYASEIVVNSYRGTCTALEQYSMTFGIGIQIIYTSLWNNIQFNANCLHGIFDILCAVLSFLCVYVWYIESPIYHLLQHEELAALNCLACLEQPRGISNAKRALLEEHKLYIKETFHNAGLTKDFIKTILVPFSKVVLLRCLMLIFSFSLPSTVAIQLGTILSIGLKSWPLILYAVLRIIGSLIAMFTIDTMGRKIITIFCVLIIGSLTLGIGIILSNPSNLLNDNKMAILCTLSLLIQLFSVIFAPNTSTYLAEAFPLKWKFHLLAFSIIMEQIIHIIIIWTIQYITDSLYIYFITSGIISILLFPIFYCILPETRKCSLNEAQKRFQNYINIKLF